MPPTEPNRAATLHDVAARVGVSPRTVSRVVNAEGGFSEATRARVQAAIDELDYRPNVLARALITRRTGTIAFIAPVLADPFFPEVAESVQRAARAAGLTMLFAMNESDPALETDLFARLSMFSPDGAIVFPATQTPDHLTPTLDRGLPMVVVDASFRHPNAASLDSDLHEAARLAVDRLADRGARRIAMLANAQTESDTDERELGFRATVARRALGEPVVVQIPATLDGGRAGVDELLDRLPDVDGVFAYNDMMAIGAIRGLVAAGRDVPGDVAVIGCDDVVTGSVVSPALTTVRIDRARLGEEAVRLLVALVEGERFVDPVVLPVELVVRESA